MNTQLQELYRRAGDAVEPTGDVREILTRAQRRRTATQVATPLAAAAVVAGAVGVVASSPWSDDAPEDAVANGDTLQAGAAVSLPEEASVAGNTYVTERASGIPDSVSLEITFHRGSYAASAGCNTFRGSYDFTDDVLVSSPMGVTAGFCPGSARADTWLDSFLSAGPQVTVDGDRLRLDDGESDVLLSVQRVEDEPLAGTTWKLDSIVDESADVVSSVPRGTASTLEYDGSDTLSVATPCGDATLRVAVGDTRIDADGDSASSSASGCRGQDAAVDDTVQEVLGGSVGYRIDGSQLQIDGKDGGLVYTAD